MTIFVVLKCLRSAKKNTVLKYYEVFWKYYHYSSINQSKVTFFKTFKEMTDPELLGEIEFKTIVV